MALTLQNGIDQVRDFLNEPTEVFWSDAEITAWIQEGTRDFSSKTLMVEDDDDITLVAGQLMYDASDHAFIGEVLEPYAALYNDGSDNWSGLVKFHPRIVGNEATNAPGKTKYYALHHRKIYVWPVATAAMVAAGAYIHLLFSKETDDITELADEYQHIPLLYAKAKAKYKDQKFAEGNALMSMYASYSNFERQDKHNREQESLDMFKIQGRGKERESA